MKNIAKTVLASIASAIGLFAFGASVTFPNAGGDISVPGDWGDIQPLPTDDAVIDKAGAYTIGSSFEIGTLSFKLSEPSLVAVPGATITLNAANKARAFAVVANEVTGGIISGGCYFTPNQATANVLYGNDLRLIQPSRLTLSGVTFTNLYVFSAVSRLNESTLVLTNGCFVHSARTAEITEKDYGRNTLDVADGSVVKCGSHLYTDQGGTDLGSESGNSLLVHGAGSKIIVGGSLYAGNAVGGHTLRISDGGAMETMQGVVFGHKAGCNNLIFETLATGSLSSITFGNDVAAASNNVLTVRSNARLDILGAVQVGKASSGNRIVVENANIAMADSANLMFGKSDVAEATDNGVTFRGQGVMSGFKELYCYNRTKFRFEVPEEGYANVPLKGTRFWWTAGTDFEVECKRFRYNGGGKIVLAECGAASWVDKNGVLADTFERLNAQQPEGCEFAVEGKQIVYYASKLERPGLMLILR